VEGHRYIAQFPVRKGPQALLIAVEHPGAREELRDLFGVLPKTTMGYSPSNDPVYASALALSIAYYKPDLAAAKEAHLFREIETVGWEDRPFARDSFDLLGPSLSMIEEEATHRGSAKVARMIHDVWDAWYGPGSAGRRWCPLHLLEEHVASDRKENWRILSKWKEWEYRGMSVRERASKFYGFQPSGDQEEAFAEKLRCLGLKAPRKVPAKRRHVPLFPRRKT